VLSFQFVSTVRLGVKSLLLHKLRSALTMLGIIFGVCSVIAMLAIGEGASYGASSPPRPPNSRAVRVPAACR
jgi:putative ABC transport system permease protein